MPFEFTSQHVVEYHQNGFTIFRDLLPPALIRDLRAQAKIACELARKRSPQAQRLQPLTAHPEIDMKPFDDYHALPALQKGLNELLAEAFGGPVDTTLSRSKQGMFFEPLETPWCTSWHRDWRDNIRGLDTPVWRKLMTDTRYFNQINMALYADECTWVVPGSHLRDDTMEEALRFPSRPITGPDLTGLDAVEMELACLNYVKSMPGAVQARLNAGDYMLYRNSVWHIGNYLPYKKRATVHDGVFSKEFIAYFNSPPIKPKNADGSGPDWDNPNVGRYGIAG